MSQIAKPNGITDDDTLTEIASFDGAVKALESVGGALVDTADFGTGFEVADNATLVGVPFVIVNMRVHDNGTYGPFAIIHAVTEDNRKVIINDGGTGIRRQVERMLAKGISGGALVRKGLTRSDYSYRNEDGKETPATTFYLS